MWQAHAPQNAKRQVWAGSEHANSQKPTQTRAHIHAWKFVAYFIMAASSGRWYTQFPHLITERI